MTIFASTYQPEDIVHVNTFRMVNNLLSRSGEASASLVLEQHMDTDHVQIGGTVTVYIDGDGMPERYQTAFEGGYAVQSHTIREQMAFMLDMLNKL